MVIVAPNIDEGRIAGGLDEKVRDIIDLATDGEVPVVYALTRRKLGKALSRRIRVSIVGVLNFDGADGVQNKVRARAC